MVIVVIGDRPRFNGINSPVGRVTVIIDIQCAELNRQKIEGEGPLSGKA